MYYEYNPDKLPHISYMNMHSCTEPTLQPERISGEFVMFIIKSGTMYITENDTAYCLNAGDMLILDPDAVHFGTKASIFEQYYIHFEPSVFRQIQISDTQALKLRLDKNRQTAYATSPFGQEMYQKSSLILPKNMTVKDPSVLNKIDLYMRQAVFASDHREEHYKLTCSVCFLQILITLSEYFSTYILSDSSDKLTKSQHILLCRLVEFLHQNYMHKLTSTDIEDYFQMNFDYLNRIFKKKNGTTIFNYLNMIRINKAIELLINQNVKIYEIAKSVGFCDEFYFSKAFKKQMGVSPANYIKLHS